MIIIFFNNIPPIYPFMRPKLLQQYLHHPNRLTLYFASPHQFLLVAHLVPVIPLLQIILRWPSIVFCHEGHYFIILCFPPFILRHAPLLIIPPQKLPNRLLLPLLLHQPLIPLHQQPLKVFGLFFPVNGSAHPLSYLWRKVIPNDDLLSLIRNLVLNNVV